jgi:hypothetical protein
VVGHFKGHRIAWTLDLGDLIGEWIAGSLGNQRLEHVRRSFTKRKRTMTDEFKMDDQDNR